MTVRDCVRGIVLTALFAATFAAAHAQGWKPEKTVEIIVPAGAGGINDTNSRRIQKTLQDEKLIGVPALVLNKPGGNQSLAVVYLNRQLEHNNLESGLTRGPELAKFLDTEYAATRAVMADIGLVK